MNELRNLLEKDLTSIVNIHKDSFAGFFLTTLGDSFLRTYYGSVIKSSRAISIGYFDESNKLKGFAVGNLVSKGFHKDLLKNNMISFGFEALKIILTNPKSIIRLSKNMDKNNNPQDDGLYAELLSIGVSSEAKGEGIGKKLIEAFEEEVYSRNGKVISLTTDFDKNEYALGFYRKRGYEIFYEFTAFPNRRMYKLIKRNK